MPEISDSSNNNDLSVLAAILWNWSSIPGLIGDQEIQELQEWVDAVLELGHSDLSFDTSAMKRIKKEIDSSEDYSHIVYKLIELVKTHNALLRFSIYLKTSSQEAAPWLRDSLEYFVVLRNAVDSGAAAYFYNAKGNWSKFWSKARISPQISLYRTVLFLSREAISVESPWEKFDPQYTLVFKNPEMDSWGNPIVKPVKTTTSMQYKMMTPGEANDAFTNYPIDRVGEVCEFLEKAEVHARKLLQKLDVTISGLTNPLAELHATLTAASGSRLVASKQEVIESENELTIAIQDIETISTLVNQANEEIGSLEVEIQEAELSEADIEAEIDAFPENLDSIQFEMESLLAEPLPEIEDSDDILVAMSNVTEWNQAMERRNKRIALVVSKMNQLIQDYSENFSELKKIGAQIVFLTKELLRELNEAAEHGIDLADARARRDASEEELRIWTAEVSQTEIEITDLEGSPIVLASAATDFERVIP